MKLYIDNKLADSDERLPLAVSFSIASVTTPEYGRTGYSRSITIPMTPANSAIMGDCEQVHARDRFNAELHTARVEHDGCVIMEGTILLSGCSCMPGGGGGYTFNIMGAGKEWVRHASAHGLGTLFPDWSKLITASAVRQSWVADTPVRFLPVERDRYEPANSSVSIMPPERFLTFSDYHPFINVRAALEATFADAGYKIKSEFIAGEWFGRLHMSGNYPERDTEVMKRRMDFLAARFAPASATADSDGYVYADPNSDYNTVGNIVDTANPKEARNGTTLDNVYTNGGYFRRIGNRMAFVPPYEISLGFEYKFKYVTDYSIKNATELNGFNAVYLGTGELREFRISNRFEDKKSEFRAGKTFRYVITERVNNRHYRFWAKRITNLAADLDNLAPGDYVNEAVGSAFSAYTGLITLDASGIYRDLELHYVNGLFYEPYKGEWSLYEGFVAESGQTEVHVTLRSKSRLVSPSRPKYFDDICFQGAWAGASFTLLEAEVRPVFLPHPAEGSMVGFSQVASHGISRLGLINAVRQMFNLYFHTDDLEKAVYIEPRSMFYSGPVVDWSGRIDRSKPYIIEELGKDMPAKMTFRYMGGDATVARLNVTTGGHFGQWSARIENPYAATSEKVFENPLFTPSVNETGCVPSAMSASCLCVGDRDLDGDAYSDELNFPPKIALYDGLADLAGSEVWGWPSYTRQYPSLAFHRPAEGGGSTLCFEDRDGMEGLHRFWDDNIKSYNTGRRLSVWLRLEPCDIEPFIRPNRMKHDFRAKFLLTIEGERGYWRLEEICDYSPSAASTKCVFVKA